MLYSIKPNTPAELASIIDDIVYSIHQHAKIRGAVPTNNIIVQELGGIRDLIRAHKKKSHAIHKIQQALDYMVSPTIALSPANTAQQGVQNKALMGMLETLEKDNKAQKALINVQDEQLNEFEQKEHHHRNIITELLERLHEADSNARVSLNSGELLTLMQGYDSDDLPFD